MALKGLGNNPVPFIPEVERTDDNPTIFWIKPKNTRENYASLNRYSDAVDTTKGGKKLVNASKMFEGDLNDFLSFCIRVDNYQFSDKYPDLAQQGVITHISDSETLQKLVDDLDPSIFSEVQDAASKWSVLKEGEKKGLKF